MRVCACTYSCVHEDVKVGTRACANLCEHARVHERGSLGVCRSAWGTFAGGKVAGRARAARGGTGTRACGRASAACVCSECATVTARPCARTRVCTHGWVLTPSAVPAARGARWDAGGAAGPRTCAVPPSPVRGAASGNAAGRGNNAASCAAGNSPEGGQGLGVAVAGATLCGNPPVPWGWDMWLCGAARRCPV